MRRSQLVSAVAQRSPFVITCSHAVDGEEKVQKLHKITRYYVSNKGCKLQKINRETGKIINVDAGAWLATVFNTYEERPFEDYDINFSYYLREITKQIESARGSQLSLFF